MIEDLCGAKNVLKRPTVKLGINKCDLRGTTDGHEIKIVKNEVNPL